MYIWNGILISLDYFGFEEDVGHYYIGEDCYCDYLMAISRYIVHAYVLNPYDLYNNARTICKCAR